MSRLWELVQSGGFAMYPLVICSLATWAVLFERIWTYRRLSRSLKAFHSEALAVLLRGGATAGAGGAAALQSLCDRYPEVPTAAIVRTALERLGARDQRLKARWREATERRRQLANQELRSALWILGTIGTSAPFIGLFGTVVGILRSFHEMATAGKGGFSVVAAGISESLVATAAGIVVAVIAVMAYNALLTHASKLILAVKMDAEELTEVLPEWA